MRENKKEGEKEETSKENIKRKRSRRKDGEVGGGRIELVGKGGKIGGREQRQ